MIKGSFMRVSILGMGYVGFPLACAIAKNKEYDVYGFDLSKEKIDLINDNVSPVEDNQAKEDIKEVSIYATTDFSNLEDSNIIILAVPTPVYEDKLPDLTLVRKATESILPYLKKNQLIILESTVNPGVCDEIVLPILESTGFKGGVDFDLLHCPERINPGDSKWNVYNIPRNIGGTSLEGTKRGADFYRSVLEAEIKEVSSLKIAEATKIIENTFRDINIAYVNELAKSFDVMDIDLVEVIEAASNKPFAFLAHYPGCGIGGHCIPVDPYYLIEKAKQVGFEHTFLKAAREVNTSMPHYTVDKLLYALNEVGKTIKGTKIGLLGLSYKANIGDLRESPSLEIQERLKDLGAEVIVCDPYVEDTNSLSETIDNVEALVLATNHKEFLENKNWGGVKVIVDGRNCLNREEIKEKGIIYKGVGRN